MTLSTETMVAVLFAMLAALVLGVFDQIRRYRRKRKYGCNRCAYRRVLSSDGRPHCTASCGNEDGKVCPAWCYQDPEDGE